MDIALVYVRDKASAAHIWDYVTERQDHALCGHPYQDPVVLDGPGRPRAVCRACQALTASAEAIRWKEIAEEFHHYVDDYEGLWREYEKLWDEYETLWQQHSDLRTHCDNQRREIRNLRATKQQRRSRRKTSPPPSRKAPAYLPRPDPEPPRKRPRVKFFG